MDSNNKNETNSSKIANTELEDEQTKAIGKILNL